MQDRTNNQTQLNTRTDQPHDRTAYHPLAEKHFRQVIRRHHAAKMAMASVWGVTWNLRGRTMVPLGSASMLCLSYHPARPVHGQTQGRDSIEMLCITAAVDPHDSSVHYDDLRMSHDFSRNPRPGARDRTLDPREEGSPVRGVIDPTPRGCGWGWMLIGGPAGHLSSPGSWG